MALWINCNSELKPADGPVIRAGNRAFRYGDGLFESIRVVNGSPLFVDDHCKRLCRGANMLRINCDGMDTEWMHREIALVIDANKITGGGRIRFSVFRASEGLYAPDSDQFGFVVEAIPIEYNDYHLNAKGLSVDIYEERLFNNDDLSTIKSINALPYVLAGIYGREHGLDDCILMDNDRHLTESINSNIFVVFNGVLYTPAMNRGFVPGIMRNKIIQLTKEERIEVQETDLRPDALMKADEVLLTNAISGVRWVLAYKNKRYYHHMAERLTAMLNQHVASSIPDLPEN